MAVRMKDIADELNLSRATVSRILNRKEGFLVSEHTKALVFETAEKMQYRPNRQARSLATGRTFNIGLVVPSLAERTDPQFTQIFSTVEPKIREHGYRLGLFGDIESIASEHVVDGAVVINSPNAPSVEPLKKIIPTMFVAPEIIADNCVTWSDADGTYQAVKHLVDAGHTNIAGVFCTGGAHKRRGFLKAVKESGLKYVEVCHSLSDDDYENGYMLTGSLLEENSDITAIFARNDFIARGAIKAIRERGLSITDDISVVGYGDTILSRNSDPELTSVYAPVAEATIVAIEQILEAIDSKINDFPLITLPTRLEIRNSSSISKSK